VVGTSGGHAFLYHAGVMMDLNDLVDPGCSCVLMSATGINDAGQIVGSSTEGAFVLNPDALLGRVSGTWQQLPTARPDAGQDLGFFGEGAVSILGAVRASGVLHLPGFIVSGYAQGTFQLANDQGSVTVQLVSAAPLPGFTGPPGTLDYTFQFTIVDSTGAYAGVQGTGQAFLHLTPAQGPDSPGTFILTFGLVPGA
jgi:hypothetical protein